MTGLGALTTPALLIDEVRLAANLASMVDTVRHAGVDLRVHLKTAKCLEIAGMLARLGVRRFAVSTIAEATAFAAAGYDDLLYTTPATPQKVPALIASGATGVIEDLMMARAIDEAARAAGTPLPVMIELDTDGIRGGVRFPSADFEHLAAFATTAQGLRVRGAMTYSGATYGTDDPMAHARIAAEHDAALSDAGQRLRASGVVDPILSTGGSPAVRAAARPGGANEFRPGVFVFWDLFQAGIGACRQDEIAVSVLSTVLSVRPDRGSALCDAGALALSLDRSTARLTQDWGLGRVCDEKGTPIGMLRIIGTSQEHGTIGGDEAALAQLVPGQHIRILPNHCCLTAAAYDRMHPVDGNGCVGGPWLRINHWSV